MAKPLVFNFRGESVQCQLDKVDRTKLYGYVETEVKDESERVCHLSTLAGDGQTIVGRGGAGIGYFSPNGLWRQKAELTPIDLEGESITPVKSSFELPIHLDQTATIDEFLSHNFHAVYQIGVDETNVRLVEELTNGTIFTFPFSYRGGLEANVAFLLLGSDGNLFLLIGTPTRLEFVGLNQPAPAVAEESATEEEEEDLLDFNLI